LLAAWVPRAQQGGEQSELAGSGILDGGCEHGFWSTAGCGRVP
jgi:hypothetical protein